MKFCNQLLPRESKGDILSGVKNHPDDANKRNSNLKDFIFPINELITVSILFGLLRRNTRSTQQFRAVRFWVTDPSAVRFRSQGANSRPERSWVTSREVERERWRREGVSSATEARRSHWRRRGNGSQAHSGVEDLWKCRERERQTVTLSIRRHDSCPCVPWKACDQRMDACDWILIGPNGPRNFYHPNFYLKISNCQTQIRSPEIRRDHGVDEATSLHRRRQCTNQEDRTCLLDQHRSQGPLSSSIFNSSSSSTTLFLICVVSICRN